MAEVVQMGNGNQGNIVQFASLNDEARILQSGDFNYAAIAQAFSYDNEALIEQYGTMDVSTINQSGANNSYAYIYNDSTSFENRVEITQQGDSHYATASTYFGPGSTITINQGSP